MKTFFTGQFISGKEAARTYKWIISKYLPTVPKGEAGKIRLSTIKVLHVSMFYTRIRREHLSDGGLGMS